MLTYSDCRNYLKKVYDGINGEINPVIPSIRLVLTEPNPNAPKDLAIVGTQCIMYVEIRLDNIYEKFNMVKLTDDQIRGGLLFVLAHELSHCDQKIIPNRKNDIEYTKYMEYTNNLNTFRFIRENWNTLQQQFGPFVVPEIAYGAYTEQREYFKGKMYAFPQISSIKEKVLDGVSLIMQEDIYKTKYPLVNNIFLTVYVGQNIYERFEIIRNKNLICGYSTILKLAQFVARALYDSYRKTCIINGDTCEMSIYLSSPPVYNVIVLS